MCSRYIISSWGCHYIHRRPTIIIVNYFFLRRISWCNSNFGYILLQTLRSSRYYFTFLKSEVLISLARKSKPWHKYASCSLLHCLSYNWAEDNQKYNNVCSSQWKYPFFVHRELNLHKGGPGISPKVSSASRSVLLYMFARKRYFWPHPSFLTQGVCALRS